VLPNARRFIRTQELDGDYKDELITGKRPQQITIRNNKRNEGNVGEPCKKWSPITKCTHSGHQPRKLGID